MSNNSCPDNDKEVEETAVLILLDTNNHKTFQTPLASIDIYQDQRLFFLPQLKF
jgi:hypothetical protein